MGLGWSQRRSCVQNLGYIPVGGWGRGRRRGHGVGEGEVVNNHNDDIRGRRKGASSATARRSASADQINCGSIAYARAGSAGGVVGSDSIAVCVCVCVEKEGKRGRTSCGREALFSRMVLGVGLRLLSLVRFPWRCVSN